MARKEGKKTGIHNVRRSSAFIMLCYYNSRWGRHREARLQHSTRNGSVFPDLWGVIHCYKGVCIDRYYVRGLVVAVQSR